MSTTTTLPISEADVALAREMASFFRSRGFNVLPSDPTKKKPLCRFAEWWESPLPTDLFDRFPTSNLQLMTGRHWRLLVIDLDGPEAREWWNRQPGRKPRTWVTHSGGDGLHIWYRLPENYSRPLPKAFLWKGEGEHSAVERLCDKSLVMCPPSIHPKTGARYRFLSKGESHLGMGLPADCPKWVLDLPPLRTEVVPVVRPSMLHEKLSVGSGRYRASDVVEAIPDKIQLVASWGVKFGPDTGREWMPCHAIDREDRNPSAAVSRKTGAYVDLGSGVKLGLFDLAAVMGVASSWTDAVASLGDRYRARELAVSA